MSDVLTKLTALAVSTFRGRNDLARSGTEPWLEPAFTSDAILRESQRARLLMPSRDPNIETVAKEIFSEPDLAPLASREGELEPMVLHPGGGYRASPIGLITGLLTSALLQIYYLRLPDDENTFVRTVLEGFEELRRAARGEKVRAQLVLGFAGVTMVEGSQITTPWGVAKPAPKPPNEFRYFDPWRPQTTCLLAQTLLVPIKFDRAPSPTADFDPFILAAERSQVLFPLACALASKESTDPAVPLTTWSTLVLPFQNGFAYSQFQVSGRMKPNTDISERAKDVEEWARILENSHAPTVDVAARRIVSASGQRLDRSDALIDAVMVWENLFGTTTEVTFRVTAAVAKALEPDPTKRRTLRKSLAKVYGVRSRVVHGEVVNAEEVNEAASQAIDVAVRVLRFCYRRGSGWLGLSSSERAEVLLLEEA